MLWSRWCLWWKKDSGEGRTHLLRAEQVIESKTDTVVTGVIFVMA